MATDRMLRRAAAWLARSARAGRARRAEQKLSVHRLEDRTVPSAAGLLDPGFEGVALPAGTFKYRPTGAAWTFSPAAGVAANSSGFTAGNPDAPDGAEVAFLQQDASVSQSASLPAGTYAVTFNAAQRGNVPQTAQTFQVLVDGNVVGTFNTLAGTAYTPLTTSTFKVSDGSHTLTFHSTNLNGGDSSVFIDQVALVPQPAAVVDAGFESPALSLGAFKYAPTGTAWTFTGVAGVAANGSGFTAGNPGAPQAGQVAFLQNQGSISQAVILPAGTYAIGFSAAQRGNKPGVQTLQVLVDGAVVGTFNTVSGNAYTTLATSTFTVTAGTHTVTFRGTNLNGGDNTAFIDQVTVTPQASGLNDSGFEQPALGPGTFKYTPAGSPWTFTAGAGVAANGSAFTSGNPGAPQGNQVAVLQRLASMSEVVDFVAGNYAITFKAAQRGNIPQAPQTFEVLVDGTVVGTFNSLAGTAYNALSTSAFAATAGRHTVTFRGTNLNGGDSTAFIDAVTISRQAAVVTDPGFEAPALAVGSFQYAPTAAAWAFAGAAGVSANGSGFTSGNPGAPQGGQVAFLQRLGAMSQTVTLGGGTYAIGFSAAQRGNQPAAQTFNVLVDGTVVGTFNGLTGAAYSSLTTPTFTATAGTHTISFQATNLNGGDNTVFIDQVYLLSA
jgi:Protein of unknown function (DUF642)